MIKRAKQLGQVSPANTAAHVLYQPAEGVLGEVTQIFITNYSGNTAEYSIYHDADGTTASNATALVYHKNMAADTYDLLDFSFQGIPVQGGGSLKVIDTTGGEITFTAYGTEVTR